ncbi:MAG: riboflavin synthase [Candidatus Moranbacteria bacterium]|nr:riboflavin synthase [Candidatus Moranbacteria bacterium]
MFTGIIKKLSKAEKVTWQKGSLFVEIKIPKGWKVKLGESISVNGVCSTVKKVSKNNFTVEYMPETVEKTTVGDYKKGTELNLERSLRMNDLLDGHLVQGHVDTTGKIVEIKNAKQSKIIKIQVPKVFMKFLAPKGSVSVDGISLTIVDSKKDWFTVSLVSYTLENTNLGKIKVGAKVNIETDAIAKYIFNILKSSGYAKC